MWKLLLEYCIFPCVDIVLEVNAPWPILFYSCLVCSGLLTVLHPCWLEKNLKQRNLFLSIQSFFCTSIFCPCIPVSDIQEIWLSVRTVARTLWGKSAMHSTWWRKLISSSSANVILGSKSIVLRFKHFLVFSVHLYLINVLKLLVCVEMTCKGEGCDQLYMEWRTGSAKYLCWNVKNEIAKEKHFCQIWFGNILKKNSKLSIVILKSMYFLKCAVLWDYNKWNWFCRYLYVMQSCKQIYSEHLKTSLCVDEFKFSLSWVHLLGLFLAALLYTKPIT